MFTTSFRPACLVVLFPVAFLAAGAAPKEEGPVPQSFRTAASREPDPHYPFLQMQGELGPKVWQKDPLFVAKYTNIHGESIELLSPGDGRVYKGKIQARVRYKAPDGDRAEDVMVFVDGIFLRNCYDGGVRQAQAADKSWESTFTIDPVQDRLLDGRHALVVLARSRRNEINGPEIPTTVPSRGFGPIAGFVGCLFVTENQTTVIQTRPEFSVIRVAPRQKKEVRTFEWLGNGKRQEKSKLVVTGASGPGVEVRLQSGVELRVVTAGNRTIPHLSRDGVIRYLYEQGKSTIVRAMFFFEPEDASDAKMAYAVKKAGVNAIRCGFFLNPAGQKITLDEWLSGRQENGKRSGGWRNWFRNSVLKPARDHDFLLLLHGDDLCRTPSARNWLENSPWARDAVVAAVTELRNCGQVVGIKLVDEADGIFGYDPSKYQSPRLIRRWFAQVPGAPPISWPGQYTQAFRNPDFADFTSAFWDVGTKGGWPHTKTLGQVRYEMERKVAGYADLPVDPTRPMLCEVQMSMGYHARRGGRALYDPDTDYLIDQTGGHFPYCITAQVWMGLAYGSAGFFAYGFDSKESKTQRAQSKPGQWLGQLSDPFTVDTPRFAALAAAYRAIADWEPLLLQEWEDPLDWGPAFVTGARTGEAGRIWWAVNATDVAQRGGPLPPGDWTHAWLIAPGGREELAMEKVENYLVPPGNVVVLTRIP